MKNAVKAVLASLGLLERARAAKRSVRYQARRDWQDTRNFAVVLAATLRSDSNCIDVGGSRGETLAPILRAAPQGSHIVVEPLPDMANALRKNYPHVTVVQAALTDHQGSVSFYTPTAADSAWSGLAKRGNIAEWREITVAATRLDDIVATGTPVDLVKIDAEGAEVLILRGGRRVIAENLPLIWLEHSEVSAKHNGTTSADLWDLMVADYGYRVFDADGRPLVRDDLLDIDRYRMWTFLFTPAAVR